MTRKAPAGKETPPEVVFARIAAVAFALNTVYPVITKSIDGRLADDWAHSALHLVSAILASLSGWLFPWMAKPFAIGLGVVYTSLGTFGWSVDGILLGTPVQVPLGPVENVFHLLLGLPALAIGAWACWRGPRP